MAAAAVLLAAAAATGCGGASAADPGQTAMQRYRAYLQNEAAVMAGWIVRLAVEAENGRVEPAKSRYASARVPFGHLEPLVFESPSLNTSLDAEPGEISGRPLTGFHQVERLVWTNHSNRARRRAARQLFLSAKAFQEKLKTAKLTPEEISRHINEVMATEVTRELLGDEELHARIDLLDLSAHIEGVEAGFRAVKPELMKEWPGFVKQIEGDFDSVYKGIAHFGIAAREPHQSRPGSPGVAFVNYDEASRPQIKELQWKIDNLDTLLSEVPNNLALAEGEE